MKKSVLTLLSAVVFVVAYSQADTGKSDKQGAVKYEEVAKLDIQIDNMTPEMQDLLPREHRNETVLYFNEDASRYENLAQNNDANIEEESEGGGMKIMISQPENIIYRDLKDQKIVAQKEFMTRVFLVESDFPKDEWKFTGKQKMILGYPCQEANRLRGEDTISAWFTPAIPIPSGPGEYGNLPGLVLAVDINNGKRSINAKSIELGPIEPARLEKPTKGKKVSQDEYDAIVDEKTKEMGGEKGGGQMIIMKIEH